MPGGALAPAAPPPPPRSQPRGGACGPARAHRVGGAPVEQVEVVVVNQVGGVQDAVGLLRHRAEGLLGARAVVGGVERGHGVLEALGRGGRLLLEREDARRGVLPQVGRELLLVLHLRRRGRRRVGRGRAGGSEWRGGAAAARPSHDQQGCRSGCPTVGNQPLGCGLASAPLQALPPRPVTATHLGGGDGVQVLQVAVLARHVGGDVKVGGGPVGDEAVHLRAGAMVNVGGRRWARQRPANPHRPSPAPCRRSWSGLQTWGASCWLRRSPAGGWERPLRPLCGWSAF